MTDVFSDDMNTAAAQPTLGLFTAVEVLLPATGLLPSKTLRLLDGSGVMNWDGMSFVGSDGDYGTWAGISEPIEDAIATQSPKFKTTFLALTAAAIQQLCSPLAQGAPVTIYYGYFDLASGLPISMPIAWFYGELDISHLTINDSRNSVDLDVVAATEIMFLSNDGAKLNGAYHQIFFPGELGFAFVDNVDHQIPWGMAGPRPDQVTDVSNFDNTPGPQSTRLRF